MNKKAGLPTAIALAVGAFSSQAFASGFALNEQSISAMGMSFAGRASAANDASTVFGNPAGMSRFERPELTLGAAGIFARTDIDDAQANLSGVLPVDGSNDGDMVPTVTIPMGYYVHPVNDRVSFGLGIYVPFGLLTDYESGFQGRYFGDYSEVEVITVQPTVSFKLTDQLSIGFGPTINYINGQLESAVFGGVGVADSRVKIEGDDTALGFNVGLLYELSPRTRMGVTYHSMVDYKLEGDTKVNGPAFSVFSGSKYDASLDLKTPESVDFGISHALDDQWTLHASATWTRWSRFESIVVENDGVPAPLQPAIGTIAEPEDWHDTWAYAIGASYQLNPQWVLRAGVGIDQSPTNNEHRSPRVPSGDRRTASLGFGWSPTKDMTIDVAYLYIDEEKVDIDQSRLVGGGPATVNYSSTYENSAHTLGAQLTYRF